MLQENHILNLVAGKYSFIDFCHSYKEKDTHDIWFAKYFHMVQWCMQWIEAIIKWSYYKVEYTYALLLKNVWFELSSRICFCRAFESFNTFE